MAEINSHPLLATDTVAVWDVLCSGTCKHKSAEECVSTTHLVFPYRGVYVHHTGQVETVAEANQVVFFNESEPYRVSHPLEGGDASLSIGIDEATLLELAPADFLHTKDRILFNRPRMRIDAPAQLLAALVRHRLARGMTETLEAEDLILSLVSRALGKRTSYAASGSVGRQNWWTAPNLCFLQILDADGRWLRLAAPSASRRSISLSCSGKSRVCRFIVINFNCGSPGRLTCLMIVQI